MKDKRRFNTFNGVFVPTTLSILGVILFLRAGWTTGSAGLVGALTILFIAKTISFITDLSLSAVATNTTVGEGGIYYIISRSLGIEIGGAIGIPLFLSQAISVAFYIIGFTESLMWLFPHLNPTVVGIVVLVIFTVIAFIGADFAVKIQMFIFAMLMLAVLSFFLIPSFHIYTQNLKPHYPSGYNFWKVFAVFFPAVTGITAGVGMSGELKNPQKSIPKGTMIAIFFTMSIYILSMIKFATIAPYNDLIEKPLIIINKSPFPYLIYLGIWAATLSSTLTFILTAPRTLQALSKDRITPAFLAWNMGSKKDEPRFGVLITFVISLAFIIAGNLNTVATVITMFFLITYGATNISAGIQDLIGNPSYRPSFRVPWWISIGGAIAVFIVMGLINLFSTIVSSILILLIYFILKRRSLKSTWGSINSGLWMSIARFALLKVEYGAFDFKNWRPNVMVFSGNPESRLHLVQFAEYLGSGNGIVTLFNLIEGDYEKHADLREKKLVGLKHFIKSNKLDAFAEVEIVKNVMNGIRIISQAHGIGHLSSNMALFSHSWGFGPTRRLEFVSLIRDLIFLKKNVLILKYNFEKGFGKYKTIDIWWGGKGRNEGLMMFIAGILKENHIWQDAKIRVVKISMEKDDVEEQEIKEKILKLNIDAEVHILPSKGNPLDELNEFSSQADLVIMGMAFPVEGKEMEFVKRFEEATSKPHSYLLVRSTEIEDFFEMKE